MTGNLDMASHNISNATVDGYMTESEIHTLIGESHIHPSDMTNKFGYLMEQPVYSPTGTLSDWKTTENCTLYTLSLPINDLFI